MHNTPQPLLWKWRWPLLGATGLLLGAFFLSGCGSNDTTKTDTNSQTVAQNEEAPENSSREEAMDKTGKGHGDAEHDATAHTHKTRLKVSTQPASPQAGQPVAMTLQINDESGQPVKEFEVVHDKLMHLVIVSKDLEAFQHVHPTYKSNGRFTITTNILQGGAYKLYADYTPKNGEQEIATHEFDIAGTPRRGETANLTPLPFKNNFMTRRVQAHEEGRDPTRNAPFYTVALMPMPFPLEAGKEAMLHFQVRDANGQPITDLEPYLGAMGHAVVLSQDTRDYLHSHPVEVGHEMGEASEGMNHSGTNHAPKATANTPEGGPDVVFHTTFPTPGLYKVWGQFKHRGRIITAPFALRVGAASREATSGNAEGAEPAPHNH